MLARWSALWRRIAPNPFLSELLSQAVRIIVIAIGVVIALNLLGASKFISTILGGAGVLGIAIGFAVRDALEKNGFTLPEPIYRLRFDQTANQLTLAVTEISASDDTKARSVDEQKTDEKANYGKTRLVSTVIDVSVDEHLQEKINQERAKDPEGDLLDQSQPIE
ncbi:MAG: hypothetical protein ACJAYF_001933 [Arenicella sp.]